MAPQACTLACIGLSQRDAEVDGHLKGDQNDDVFAFTLT